MRALGIALLVGAVGCGGGDDTDREGSTGSAGTGTGGTTGDPDPTGTPLPTGAVSELRLDTRDGVELVADLYQGAPGAPGVVLLHMTPEGPYSRADWPASFISRLTAHAWSVVALDRRGAGESGGEARDAHLGEKGRFDVEAAVGALTRAGAGDLAIVGASNGTTSMIDYAVWAPSEGLPAPVALGFMTGGTYTENQNAMSTLPAVAAVFTYSTEEREWSEAQRALDPGGWRFLEYPDGDHGTRMFDAAPEVSEDLDAFFTEVLAR